jgi:hypothetical protein
MASVQEIYMNQSPSQCNVIWGGGMRMRWRRKRRRR